MQDGEFASLYFMNTGLGSEDVKRQRKIYLLIKMWKYNPHKGFLKKMTMV